MCLFIDFILDTGEVVLQFLHLDVQFPQIVNVVENVEFARCHWLMPVILATQEAQIRRIVVQIQLGRIV
jgi:hypothetical protein